MDSNYPWLKTARPEEVPAALHILKLNSPISLDDAVATMDFVELWSVSTALRTLTPAEWDQIQLGLPSP